MSAILPDRATISTTVTACLATVLEVDASTISETQLFKEDLNADSLHLVEFSYEIERIFSEMTGDFTVKDEDLATLKTVGDTVNYVYAALHK
ncbi:MAG: acyl carrier protein [Ilumatobacteraceae bacterium]|nr:acyl carrier protein [Ilumatobacteraceae bacterium]